MKGDGGAVGLTENSKALHRWMVSGPEMARLVEEFNSTKTGRWEKDQRHHEAQKHSQMAFAKDIKSLTRVMQDLGNPFSEKGSDLLVLDSRDIVHTAVGDTLLTIEQIGIEQYELYVSERLINKTKPISHAIKRNNLNLFSRPPVREKSNKQLQLTSMKNDCSLFSRLYIASQTRNEDLDEFFRHENQAYPPALSKLGSLRTGTKSDLLACFERIAPTNTTKPTVEITIIDGAAIVNMLRPGLTKTFEDYANTVFVPYIKSLIQNVRRIDVVWDVYMPDSLKSDTRSKRGKGVRKRVEPRSPLPKNWEEFLRVDENKTELFSFLATTIADISTDKQVITTIGSDVLTINRQDVLRLAPCTHEEADTRILLHLSDAVQQGYTKAEIRTVDTDVLVLVILSAQRLNIDELWVAFGVGKNYRIFAAHELARSLGRDRCTALPLFHAITGCDTVSFFGGRGKKTAWDTWNAYQDITATFCALADRPTQQTVQDMLKPLERFIVLIYDRTSSDDSVNDARKHLFFQKSRAMDNLPPTQDALIQHTKRAIYQASYCWAQMMVAIPVLPSPADRGWKKKVEGGWEISWTTLPEASQACRELIRCGCKKGCTRQCQCKKAALQCTALCVCGGICTQ